MESSPRLLLKRTYQYRLDKPFLTKVSGTTAQFWEGCLSLLVKIFRKSISRTGCCPFLFLFGFHVHVQYEATLRGCGFFFFYSICLHLCSRRPILRRFKFSNHWSLRAVNQTCRISLHGAHRNSVLLNYFFFFW